MLIMMLTITILIIIIMLIMILTIEDRRPGIVRLLEQVVHHQGSRSLTQLTRQITPPTKNGHAPPPIESRKSSGLNTGIYTFTYIYIYIYIYIYA